MWKRTQNWLRIESGYTGPIDGVPGTNTWTAVQRLAAQNGYTGPIDDVMGPNSWRGFSHFINQDRWN
ncbi:hypothetical protein [Streptomyces brevispora]|uniref:Peptidoglycan binding protein n=1 Tax=Streptomyces brevispora TaxID=887462 RepID=A0A561TXE5_9ACTN|nr:hypothetical protein [Streptomyces brevispora]TWF91782.1 hypothetical protein FHX80_1297 [Streptomyces brevispora]WSC17236.1 hypothetical protein OIE64_33390 [Streptomyces brevispora]